MSKFTAQHNCCVVFHPHFCLFKDLLTGKITGIGKQKHGFYYFFQPKSYVVATEYLPLNVSQLNIVSSISLPVMLHLVKTMILIYGIDVLVTCLFLDYNICLLLHKNLATHCHVCPMSKQIRAPFPITSPILGWWHLHASTRMLPSSSSPILGWWQLHSSSSSSSSSSMAVHLGIMFILPLLHPFNIQHHMV